MKQTAESIMKMYLDWMELLESEFRDNQKDLGDENYWRGCADACASIKSTIEKDIREEIWK